MSALNNRLNGIDINDIPDRAFDIDGNGDIEPTDKTLLNNIINGVPIN